MCGSLPLSPETTEREDPGCHGPACHERGHSRAHEAASNPCKKMAGLRLGRAPRPRGSPVLEPPGVSPSVPAVVVVRTRVALATQARGLRALLRLVAAQHEVSV